MTTPAPPTATLAAWLEQQVAADEALAAAATAGPWEVGDWWHIQGAKHCRCGTGPLVWEGVRDVNGSRMATHVHRRNEPIGGDIMQADASAGCPASVSFGSDYGPGVDEADAAHIAAQDPAQTLRRVAAIRQVLALHAGTPKLRTWLEERPYMLPGECQVCEDGPGRGRDEIDHQPMPCPTLRALASMFADRDGYRAEEWA